MADDWEQYAVSNDSTDWEQYATDNKQSSVATQTNPLLGKDMSGVIADRPSLIKEAFNPNLSFKEHPFIKSAVGLGAGFEVLEGVPSSVALDIQAGKPKDIIPNIGKVLKGERPAQRGDILRAIGVPEPIAATIGLMSGMSGSGKTNISKISKMLPENVAADMLGKATSTAYKVSGLESLVKNYGKPAIARTLSVLSSVQKQMVEKAIDNPNFLSRRFLNKEGVAVREAYNKVIKPLIKDTKNRVDISGLDITDLELLTPSGEPTKAWVSMRPTEQRKLLKWYDKAFKAQGDLSFNEVDGIIGQMDEALQSKVYTKESIGKSVDYSNDFIRTTRALRNKLDVIRKSQYPEVGKVLDRYSRYLDGKKLYDVFETYHPHLWQTLIGGGVGVMNKGVGAGVIAGSIPKVQALGIRGGSLLSEVMRESGAATPEALFDLYRQNQSNNSLSPSF